MTAIPLVIEPRDGAFLKDGRGWCTSESNRAGSLAWPFGTTLRGGIRAGLGYAAETERAGCLTRDEWLPLNADVEVAAVLPLYRLAGEAWSPRGRCWPAPLDAVGLKLASSADLPQIHPLRPTPPPAEILPLDDSPDEQALARAWHPLHDQPVGKPVPLPAFWDEAAFINWLCEKTVDAGLLLRTPQPLRRFQTHVALDPNRATGAAGQLFSSAILEPHAKDHEGRVGSWGFGVVSGTLGNARATCLDAATIRLGGDGRPAICRRLPADLAQPPHQLLDAFAAGPRGLRIVLVGPASFGSGWRPGTFAAEAGRLVGSFGGLDGLVLHAACVGRPQHVSGWDMARRRPKQSRRLAAAGSVFFVTKQTGDAFTQAEAERLWLAAVGEPADDPERLGAVVPGIWAPSDELLKDLSRRTV